MTVAELRPPRVFISYSHDSAEHAARVLRLANELRHNRIDAVIDQYFTSPPEGWPAWMDAHIRDDDFVVLVCTETYYRRVIRKEAPGIGFGVAWEGGLIYNHIYRAKVDLTRFVPVLLNGGSPDYIPEILSGTIYHAETPDGFEGLLRRLFERPGAVMPPLGKLPPLPQLGERRPLAELSGVPELPPHFVARSAEVAALAEKLLATNGSLVGVTGVATKLGLQGMGGIGKSVLAAAVVREDAVRAAFPGGVFWLALGQTPDLLTRQASLYSLLTSKTADFKDAQDGRLKLQQVLRGRDCLVVLDDVWRLADAEAFNVLDTEARLLLTTRDGAIVRAIGASEHEVARLGRPQSLRLLAETARIAEDDLPAVADAIARECGDLPLALALAGGMIGGQEDMWHPVLDVLRAADLEQIEGEFPGYPYPHVFTAVEASVEALGSDKERYLDLAIFPEDVPIPQTVLAALWSGSGSGTLQNRARINRFRDRSLVQIAADGSVTMHDLQQDFVRKRAGDLAGRHRRLVEAWRNQCRDGWARGPTDDYFFRYLPLHLHQAGLDKELRELLLDPCWMTAKLGAIDVLAVISDYDRLPGDEDLNLVHVALQLSAASLTRDTSQLAGQLKGRLWGLERPRVAALVAGIEQQVRRTWLSPQTRTLTPPGGAPIVGHAGSVPALAVSPDGTRAVSGSSDCTVRLWDLLTYAELSCLEGDASPVSALALTHDGTRVLSAHRDHTLRLRDVATGAELRCLRAHRRKIVALAMMPDGTRAVSASADRTLRLWNLTTGDELRCLGGYKDWVMALAVMPQGTGVVSASSDGTLRLWDLETDPELRRLEVHENWMLALAVTPDGTRVVSGASDCTLGLWDLTTCAELRRFKGHEDQVNAVSVTPDGTKVLSGSSDRTLRLWDMVSGEEVCCYSADGAILSTACASNTTFVAGSVDGGVHMLKLTT